MSIGMGGRGTEAGDPQNLKGTVQILREILV